MGTKLQTIPTGLNCGNWDPPAETPSQIYCMFFDMLKGNKVGAREPPNGHIFELPQDPLSPCDWIYNNPAFDWEIHLNLQAGNVSIDLRESVIPNRIYFDDWFVQPPFPANSVFTNDYQTPVNHYGYAGFCVVYWMGTILALADLLSLLDVPDLFFELFSAQPPNLVVKFCSHSLRINTKVKFPI